MTELELIIDLHKNSERQGPGSENDTLKAIDFEKQLIRLKDKDFKYVIEDKDSGYTSENKKFTIFTT
jgi:hypothetical protein